MIQSLAGATRQDQIELKMYVPWDAEISSPLTLMEIFTLMHEEECTKFSLWNCFNYRTWK